MNGPELEHILECRVRQADFQSCINSIQHSWHTSLVKMRDGTNVAEEAITQRLQAVVIAEDLMELFVGSYVAKRLTSAAIRLAEIQFQLETIDSCVLKWKGAIDV